MNKLITLIAGWLMVVQLSAQTITDIVVNSPVHETLEDAVIAANLAGTLSGAGPFTVFAPTDAAFSALPTGTLQNLLSDPDGALTDILLYHVVSGTNPSSSLADGQIIETVLGQDITVSITNGNVFINNAQVIVDNIIATNGIVHVIDAVLLPELLPNTVVDVVVNSPIHTTLETAVLAAGLAETLSGPGPFTVFAPTDAAFSNLPAGVLEAALNDPTGLLTNVLLYHVVAGEALSSSLNNGDMIQTLLGEDITVTINAQGVFINNAQVQVADVLTYNGVVHVIDVVLLPPTDEPTTVLDIITESPVHTTLETAVNAAGLGAALEGDGPLTVFAPTDAAFSVLPAEALSAALADPNGLLTQILLYHVVGASAPASSLENGEQIITLQGGALTVTINAEGVFINNAEVTATDIMADNGIVHVIDAVLLPPAPETTTVFDIISDSPAHNTLQAAIEAAELVETLESAGPFTVFAPTDDAFAALPEGLVETLLADPTGQLTDILLYHVVAGEALAASLSNGDEITTVFGQDVVVTINAQGVFINDAEVVMTDLQADNGVVHVIDAVLVPQAPVSNTVVDVIVASDVHNTLEAAVIAAGLVETLQGAGPFTVFAPTDAAFEALPAGLLETLLADPSGDLTDILLYHVVSGLALSTSLENGQEITTVLGQDVVVTINQDGVFINDAEVVLADIEADNGVIHVIDAVLVPELGSEPTIMDIVTDSPNHNTLQAALEAAQLNSTLTNDGPFTLFAPTDAAFDALPDGLVETLLADPEGLLTQILLYHVTDGAVLAGSLSDQQVITMLNGTTATITLNAQGAFINDAEITVTDLIASNGVVHVIDAVLVPEVPTLTVWDIIVNSPVHTTLEAAVLAADLDGALSGDGPFTVFAPTDQAFSLLPAALVADLLDDVPPTNLTQILLYHVIGSENLAASLTDGESLTTLQGQNLTVDITAGGVFVNNAQVVATDIQADNGVVHVINAVLVPTGIVNVSETGTIEARIYPNPTQDFIRIDVANGEKGVLEIYDMTGKRVAQENINGVSQQVDVRDLAPGMYSMRVLMDNNAASFNFIRK